MKILLTAFDPFNGEAVNPAQEAVKLVRSELFNAELCKLYLPTVFGQSQEILFDALRREKPDAVLCVGQAGGTCAISVERVAINLNDATIADNVGRIPHEEAIRADGPVAYFSTLPIQAIVRALQEAGIPAAISNTAGTFVCNHILYGLLDTLAKSYPTTRGGFIHVPFIPTQVLDKPKMPSMALSTIAQALEVALQTIIATQNA